MMRAHTTKLDRTAEAAVHHIGNFWVHRFWLRNEEAVASDEAHFATRRRAACLAHSSRAPVGGSPESGRQHTPVEFTGKIIDVDFFFSKGRTVISQKVPECKVRVSSALLDADVLDAPVDLL